MKLSFKLHDSPTHSGHVDDPIITPTPVTITTHATAQDIRPFLGPDSCPKCPQCMEEPQTLEPWLQRRQNRQRIFVGPSPLLGVLLTDPEKVLALNRALGTRLNNKINLTYF